MLSKKLWRKNSIVVFVLFTTFLLVTNISESLAQVKKEVELSAGTVVALSIEESIDSEDSEGEDLNLRVIRDVKVDDNVVIEAGAIATGTIADASESSAVGSGGKVAIKINSVKAVDGQEIYLRGALEKKGKDKVVLSVVLALICLPLILIQGEDASIPAGTEIRSYVEQDYQIELNSEN